MVPVIDKRKTGEQIRKYMNLRGLTVQDVKAYLSLSRHRLWEIIREDTDEQEIVEEILLLNEPVRRLRTTLWEKTSYGKSSKSIRYKKLPIGKKLAKAIENTKKEEYRGR